MYYIYLYMSVYIHTVIGCVCPLNMGKETDTQQAEQPYLSKLSKLRAEQTFALTPRYKTGRSVNTFPLSPLQPHLSMYITFWGMADKGRGCGAPCCLPWLQQAKVLSIKKLFDFVAWQVARAALLPRPPPPPHLPRCAALWGNPWMTLSWHLLMANFRFAIWAKAAFKLHSKCNFICRFSRFQKPTRRWRGTDKGQGKGHP